MEINNSSPLQNDANINDQNINNPIFIIPTIKDVEKRLQSTKTPILFKPSSSLVSTTNTTSSSDQVHINNYTQKNSFQNDTSIIHNDFASSQINSKQSTTTFSTNSSTTTTTTTTTNDDNNDYDSLFNTPIQINNDILPSTSNTSIPLPHTTNNNYNNDNNDNAKVLKTFKTISSRNIIVSHRQKGNPLLNYIRKVAWEYNQYITPDYVLGAKMGALYISLKYHQLHPDYLSKRIQLLDSFYQLRIILCHVDMENNENIVQELSLLALKSNCTLVVGWSFDEVARYLETYKMFENKPATIIKERIETDYLSQLSEFLTNIRSVNKNDVVNLATDFRSLKKIMSASMEELSLCSGLGEKKVKRVYDAFHEPFIAKNKTKTRTLTQQTLA